jgi:hypothetical protein
LAVVIATWILSLLPWRLIPIVGDLLSMLLLAVGLYIAIALGCSLTPESVDADTAAKRWP